MEEFYDVRKGSYILANMPVSNFMKENGAMKLDCGIYFIKKDYDGTPTKETCALLGIPLLNVTDFLDETCAFVTSIKQDRNLSYIKDIHKLSVKHVQKPISKFKDFFKREDTDELLLFNIEPKGEGLYEDKYPEPRITIPGGGMEEQDLRDFEKCGIREFEEETGLNISKSYEKISREKIKRGFKFTHFSSNRNNLKMFLIKNKYDNKKSISMYYLVRIE